MARVPAGELERLKREVSIARLAEAAGVELRKHGADLLGLCPFHEDHEPSLVVSPEKNLWHCLGACQAGGSVVDWVMRVEKVSFRQAVETLRAMAGFGAVAAEAGDHPDLGKFSGFDGTKPALKVSGSPPVGKNPGLGGTKSAAEPGSVGAAPRGGPSGVAGQKGGHGGPPLLGGAGKYGSLDDAALLAEVVAFYHEALKKSPEALQYLEERGLQEVELIERFKLGFADRSLGLQLPAKVVKAGAEIRGRLQKLGILRESGHEHFNGSLVVPVFDAAGNVVEIYGRKVTRETKLRKGTPLHLYLPGPHRGVFNLAALQSSKEVILCEALLDALTFWVHGFRNVTSAYGIEGFTKEHAEAFEAYGIERVLIAYDRDEAGDRAAEKLAQKLEARGIACYRVQFPRGMDANEYALKMTPAGKALDLVLRQAVAMNSAATPSPQPSPASGRGGQNSENAPPAAGPAEGGHGGPPLPAGEGRGEGLPAEVKPEEVVITLAERRYRVRGLGRNLSFDVLKINLLAGRGEAFHVDTLDLYSAKQRAVYVKAAALELGQDEETIKRDLGKVLMKLEEMQGEQIKKALEPKKPQAVEVPEAEKAEALALLRAPELGSKILEDFRRCGLVGEETNLLMGYLACVSRKLDHPLAVVVQSSSAAGKSALMEAVLALMPAEERVSYSAMTGQSLFYMGGSNLKHKILAIAEEEGAERASYALKLLQSEGELTIASTGKDPHSGKLVTHEYRVEGPVAIFLTTTAIDVDEELLNRCLVLSVEESREQTRAIHRRQRERRTLEGLLASSEREDVLKLHQNAQRLLRPLEVVNPYARELTFLDTQIRTRRDHEKYLTLIDAIALLHQHQREVKKAERHGKPIEYIEVELADIETANRLAHEVLGRSLDELPPQTRRLLGLLDEMVTESCEKLKMERGEYRFSRRAVREYGGWALTPLRKHLERLVELEYLLVHRGSRGQGFVYELFYQGEGLDGRPFVPGLIDPERLKNPNCDANLAPLESNLARQGKNLAPSKLPQSSGVARGWPTQKTSRKQASNPDFEGFSPKNAHLEAEEKPRPTRKSAAVLVGAGPRARPSAGNHAGPSIGPSDPRQMPLSLAASGAGEG